MRCTVLPVSGEAFVAQLALLSIVSKVNKVILSSSGGNIAAYIGLSADYNPYSMERVLRSVDSSMLLKSWWPSPLGFMPSWVAGYSRGSYYDRGTGFESLFQTLFTPDTIASKEIWTGTTSCSTSKSQLFCNRRSEDVRLKVSEFTYDEFNTLPLRYLDKNISDISSITLASASIPSLVPPVIFNGENYVDGGATYASPLTPMSSVLRCYDKIHIDYLNSFDVLSSNPLCTQNMGTLIKTTTTEMIHSMILQDRSIGIEIIRKGADKLNYFEFCCSEDILRDIYSFRKTIKRSFLEIYPDKYYAVKMDNYDFNEAKKILWLDRQKFKCRFWWTGNKSLDDYEMADHIKNACCPVALV